MKTALYTTVHPTSAPYLNDFFKSVARQVDTAFDLWIGLDMLKPEEIGAALGPVEARFVLAEKGDTPASLRQRAWEPIVASYDAVILVDSDDVLYPERVADAKAHLHDCDVFGCALSLIAEDGTPLGLNFQAPPRSDWTELISKYNVFGLSNTAYRCEVLAKTLPVPPNVSLVDWFLVTRAYLAGARLSFGATCGMAYRQYHDNTARVLPPFTAQQIARATQHVLEHYQHVLEHLPAGVRTPVSPFEERFGEVQRFADAAREDAFKRYTRALNARTQPVYLWWECVAHKELEALWNL